MGLLTPRDRTEKDAKQGDVAHVFAKQKGGFTGKAAGHRTWTKTKPFEVPRPGRK